MADAPRAKPATSEHSARKVAYAKPESSAVVAGRRKFFTYRDLGVDQASGRTISAQVHQSIKGLGEPTGWHYHTCNDHFIYVLKGWVDLEFETGEKHHIEAGHSCYIPGGLKHNETDMSEDYEVLEVHTPGGPMGTVACDPPEGLASRAR